MPKGKEKNNKKRKNVTIHCIDIKYIHHSKE